MEENLKPVLEKIVRNQKWITDVYADGNEFYFRFHGHAFSIIKRSESDSVWGEYSFFVYPDFSGSFKQLALDFQFTPDTLKYVAYHESEIADHEISALMAKLYRSVRERAYGIDTIFDLIIQSPDL